MSVFVPQSAPFDEGHLADAPPVELGDHGVAVVLDAGAGVARAVAVARAAIVLPSMVMPLLWQ